MSNFGIVSICVTVLACIFIICLSSSYDARIAKEAMMECLKAKSFNCSMK